MATKRFIIAVDLGDTECQKCPLHLISERIKAGRIFIPKGATCLHFNLATMKIKEYDKESNTKTS